VNADAASAAAPVAETEARDALHASWMPLLTIALAQMLMVFNVSTLQVSIDGIASSFDAPATTVGTAIVTYSLVVAGLIMLGARIAQVIGSRRVFRLAVALLGAAMAVMALARNVPMMLVAQVVAGLAAAGLVPALVVMIADHYTGHQRAKALAWLGGAQALGIVLAFLIAGYLATAVGWRFTFGGLVAVAALVYVLAGRLDVRPTPAGVSIDWTGIVLAAAAILLISVGANNLTDWGGLLARPAAPFAVLDMSPAPMMIIAGLFLIEAFVTWSRRRGAHGKTPLVALDVVDTAAERAALLSMFTIGAIGSALTFFRVTSGARGSPRSRGARFLDAARRHRARAAAPRFQSRHAQGLRRRDRGKPRHVRERGENGHRAALPRRRRRHHARREDDRALRRPPRVSCDGGDDGRRDDAHGLRSGRGHHDPRANDRRPSVRGVDSDVGHDDLGPLQRQPAIPSARLARRRPGDRHRSGIPRRRLSRRVGAMAGDLRAARGLLGRAVRLDRAAPRRRRARDDRRRRRGLRPRGVRDAADRRRRGPGRLLGRPATASTVAPTDSFCNVSSRLSIVAWISLPNLSSICSSTCRSTSAALSENRSSSPIPDSSNRRSGTSDTNA